MTIHSEIFEQWLGIILQRWLLVGARGIAIAFNTCHISCWSDFCVIINYWLRLLELHLFLKDNTQCLFKLFDILTVHLIKSSLKFFTFHRCLKVCDLVFLWVICRNCFKFFVRWVSLFNETMLFLFVYVFLFIDLHTIWAATCLDYTIWIILVRFSTWYNANSIF